MGEELGNLVKRMPFSSQRKRMSTIVERSEGAPRRLLIKGASEYVLKSCKYIHNLQTDKVRPLTDMVRQSFSERITTISEKMLKSIAIAYKDLDPNSKEDLEECDS